MRGAAVLPVLAALLLVVAIIASGIGPYPIPPQDVVAALSPRALQPGAAVGDLLGTAPARLGVLQPVFVQCHTGPGDPQDAVHQALLLPQQTLGGDADGEAPGRRQAELTEEGAIPLGLHQTVPVRLTAPRPAEQDPDSTLLS